MWVQHNVSVFHIQVFYIPVYRVSVNHYSIGSYPSFDVLRIRESVEKPFIGDLCANVSVYDYYAVNY